MNKKPLQLTICYEVERVGKVTYSSADSELILNYMLDHDCEVGQAIALLIGQGKIKDYPEDIGTDTWCDCSYYCAKIKPE